MFYAVHVVKYNEWNKVSYSLHFFTSLWYKIMLFKSMCKSKSNLIILPKMCNVTDYTTDYNFCHVICK